MSWLSCFIPVSLSDVKAGWGDWVRLAQDLLMRTELEEGWSVENLALVEFCLSTRGAGKAQWLNSWNKDGKEPGTTTVHANPGSFLETEEPMCRSRIRRSPACVS